MAGFDPSIEVVGTRRMYRRYAAAFLAECAGTPTPDWSRLTVPTIGAFVQARTSGLCQSSCRSPATATVRSSASWPPAVWFPPESHRPAPAARDHTGKAASGREASDASTDRLRRGIGGAGRADRRSAGARDRSRRTPSRRAGGAPRQTYPVSRHGRYGHSRAQGRNRAAPRQTARRFGQNPRGQARGRLDGRTPAPQDRHPDARPGLSLLHGRHRDGRQSRYRPRTFPLRPARVPRSRTPPFRRCRPQGHPRRRRALDLGPRRRVFPRCDPDRRHLPRQKPPLGTSPRPSTHPGPNSPRSGRNNDGAK